jgi:hypothetical protein
VYAKVFSQIFDSSIAENHLTRWVFTDLCVLADRDGVVDMTAAAISRRTNAPVEVVEHALAELSKPDPQSRSGEEDGRRIVLIDSHRDWGWRIVNYEKYRNTRDDETRREQNRNAKRKQRQRERESANPASAPVSNGQHGQPRSAQAEAEAEAEAKTSLAPDGASPLPADRPEEFANVWNRERGPLAKVSKFTESRRRKVKARQREGMTPERFAEVVRQCVSTPFLLGSNNRGWKVDFDWLIANDGNALKVLEGRYDQTTGGNGNGNGHTRTSAAQERKDRGERAIDAMLAKRGLSRTDGAGGSTPNGVSPSGSGGLAGDGDERLRDSSAASRPDAGASSNGAAARRTGPEILPPGGGTQ